MANVRIKDLPADGAPKQTDLIPIDLGSTRHATVKAVVESGRPTATKTEAEAGVDPKKAMTPLTTKQAIDAQVGASYVPKTVKVNAGSGMTGGGALTGDVTVGLTATNVDRLDKVDGIEAGATKNETDAHLLARANHTGTQAISTVSGLQGALDGKLPVDGVATDSDKLGGETAQEWADKINVGGIYDTKAAAQAANIPSSVNAIRLNGYHSAGDGGGALYKRVGTQPSHAGKVQSADGAWWEIADNLYNVKMYGAKGDGISDDTDAIQSAIDASKSFPDPNNYTRGGTVNFPDGRYMISDALKIDKSISLIGVGNASIVGDLSSATKKVGIYLGDPAYLNDAAPGYHRVFIENINFGDLVGGEADIQSDGIRTIVLSRCSFSGGSISSVVIEGAWSSSRVTDCWFQGGGAKGLWLRDGCNAFEVRGNRFAGYTWGSGTEFAIHVMGSQGVWIHHNDIEYCRRGIHVNATPTNSVDSLVIDTNWIEGSHNGAIFIDNTVGTCRGFRIANNSMWSDLNGRVYLGETGGTGEIKGGIVMGNIMTGSGGVDRRSDQSVYGGIHYFGNFPLSQNQ